MTYFVFTIWGWSLYSPGGGPLHDKMFVPTFKKMVHKSVQMARPETSSVVYESNHRPVVPEFWLDPEFWLLL